MKKVLIILVVVVVAAALGVWYFYSFSYGPSGFPLGSIIVAGARWNVYVAYTQAQQEEGYMHQHSIGSCNGKGDCLGMLFPMNKTEKICMWMHDTPIPLYQYWIADNEIVYAYNGVPFSDTIICHIGNAVLETDKFIQLNSSVYFNYT